MRAGGVCCDTTNGDVVNGDEVEKEQESTGDVTITETVAML